MLTTLLVYLGEIPHITKDFVNERKIIKIDNLYSKLHCEL